MLQVRAKPAESIIKKFRRNTCNGEKSQRLKSRKFVLDVILIAPFYFFLCAFA